MSERLFQGDLHDTAAVARLRAWMDNHPLATCPVFREPTLTGMGFFVTTHAL